MEGHPFQKYSDVCYSLLWIRIPNMELKWLPATTMIHILRRNYISKETIRNCYEKIENGTLKIHMLQLNSTFITNRGDESMEKGIIRPNYTQVSQYNPLPLDTDVWTVYATTIVQGGKSLESSFLKSFLQNCFSPTVSWNSLHRNVSD